MNDSLPPLAIELATAQLGRMRGMTVEYHRQFFTNIRLAMVLIVALFVTALWIDMLIALLIPFVALWAAVQTAFDASYLIFARQYAARLEEHLNDRAGETVLVGGRMEAAYLFPLDTPKIVTIPLGPGFSWFGYVTIFFTVLGVTAYGFGLGMGWGPLRDVGDPWQTAYASVLGILTVASLGAGIWWFPLGTGERRLNQALGDFGSR